MSAGPRVFDWHIPENGWETWTCRDDMEPFTAYAIREALVCIGEREEDSEYIIVDRDTLAGLIGGRKVDDLEADKTAYELWKNGY